MPFYGILISYDFNPSFGGTRRITIILDL